MDVNDVNECLEFEKQIEELIKAALENIAREEAAMAESSFVSASASSVNHIDIDGVGVGNGYDDYYDITNETTKRRKIN
jgi:hypothetical protein